MAHERQDAAPTSPQERAGEVKAWLDQILESSDNISQKTDGLNAAYSLRQRLKDNEGVGASGDIFRHVGGFNIILVSINQINLQIDDRDLTRPGDSTIREEIVVLLGVLAAALHGNVANAKSFDDSNGWINLQRALSNLLLKTSKELSAYLPVLLDSIEGQLLSWALDDESIFDIFQHARRESVVSGESTEPATSDYLKKRLGKGVRTRAAPPLWIMLELWMFCKELIVRQEWSKDAMPWDIPMLLVSVLNASDSNVLATRSTPFLTSVFTFLCSQADTSLPKSSSLIVLAELLLNAGIYTLIDAHTLFQSARKHAIFADLLHKSVKATMNPPYISFDLSSEAFASLEFRTLGRSFPPRSDSNGYTLSMCFQVLQFDKNSHTTLFGAFDPSQTCFLLLYIEKDTQNLILQTSITSSRPSVRFKSTIFKEKRWYHVAITHRQPKSTISSRASLFVNGDFVEQVKSQYPASPPAQAHSSGSRQRNSQQNHVQVFFGTPQDLASQVGRNLSQTQWRLSSAQLFAEVLSDDLLAVQFELGPRYFGNFQDCLGSFQTYHASARLNIRNESLHPGREEKSDIVLAIRSKAGNILPEERLLINISAFNTGRSSIIKPDRVNRAHLIHGSLGLPTISTSRHSEFVLNGALPIIADALTQPAGHGILTGDTKASLPETLDDSAWCLAGCVPICLQLLQDSRTDEDFLRNLEILFGLMALNWRNSEAMEKEAGFGVLGNIIGSYLEKYLEYNSSPMAAEADRDTPLEVLKLITSFTGHHPQRPDSSMINNPLAYRSLIVELDIWRLCSQAVHKFYYDQFLILTQRSRYKHFNIKRLARMRIIKKWLDHLSDQRFTPTAFEHFCPVFKTLLFENTSTEIMRLLALFITFAVYKSTSKSSSLVVAQKGKTESPLPDRWYSLGTTETAKNRSDNGSLSQLSLRQIAAEMLNIFAELLSRTENSVLVKRFTRTVTNKWLLYLLIEDDDEIVLIATRLLAQLLVNGGDSFMLKFEIKDKGFIILQHRLVRLWRSQQVWLICLSILFGRLPNQDALMKNLDSERLLEIFGSDNQRAIYCPQMIQVIIFMLRSGISALTGIQYNNSSSTRDEDNTDFSSSANAGSREVWPSESKKIVTEESHEMKTIRTILDFLCVMHVRSQPFRDLAASSNYIQELFALLFPLIVSTGPVSAQTELDSRHSCLTFGGADVAMRPVMTNATDRPPIVRTVTPNMTQSTSTAKPQPPQRTTSYVLVDPAEDRNIVKTAKFRPAVSPKINWSKLDTDDTITDEILKIIFAVFKDQLFERKDFPGLGLFMRVPPGFQEHQAYFETFIMRRFLSYIGVHIKTHEEILQEPRNLTNLSRLSSHLGEAIYEGWFIDGAEYSIDFIGEIVEYLMKPEVGNLKSVRLCHQIIANLRFVLNRVVLLRLSELDDLQSVDHMKSFMNKLLHWQAVIFTSHDTLAEYLPLFVLLLYTRLDSEDSQIQTYACDLLRALFMHNKEDVLPILSAVTTNASAPLLQIFSNIKETENEAFIEWVSTQKSELDRKVFTDLSKLWTKFVASEDSRTIETARIRVSKRREKLKIWAAEESTNEEIIRHNTVASQHWRLDIYTAEHMKRQRAAQDQQDSASYNRNAWSKMQQTLTGPCGVFEQKKAQRWRLDQTEGRNRMRMRFLPDYNAVPVQTPSKRRKSHSIKTFVQNSFSTRKGTEIIDGSSARNGASRELPSRKSEASGTDGTAEDTSIDAVNDEDDFELISSPAPEMDDYEDKNRKVMRSLQRGDQVQKVHNVSRIIGLEAIEGLLILGKAHMYLLDGLIQRKDGEIIYSASAPHEDRDPYLQLIAGRHTSTSDTPMPKTSFETRNWPWHDILSISKRRFLFREVAIELFFVDGRSYLLTARDSNQRDELYQHLLNKAPACNERALASMGQKSWRLETLRNLDDEGRSIGSKLSSVFGQQNINPATRSWMKGEISNFHYLMLINTLAGRTFNDLTQYPVFPWVLADYTSEELDLSNPNSFRDLAKPMGCQTKSRQADFRERFQSFAEMGDEKAPPFHYGTHYSSAMIVTSYLIRLQPFVHSYLLLQGGNFDHADRLFYSIEKAWKSASQSNMTDVRELIPEFYYLPEFLSNTNDFDLGERQGSGGRIDSVALPPWARGDPNVFIEKHREALESEYVSKHLHAWIDLIFGQKQRGEAAREATNVFHHLSYQGAKDLDTIEDPMERLATIGIIHNFGQTPFQIFPRAHPPREVSKFKVRHIDLAAEDLTRLPFPVTESKNPISSLEWSARHGKLVHNKPLKLNIGPSYERFMEWGFFDGSVRFFSADNRKLVGLFEHVHVSHISTALFADSTTLITAGYDCTVSVWTVTATTKSVDLQARKTLFGHKTAIEVLAVSRSLSALLSASADGSVILWDINRLRLVRILTQGSSVQCAKINDVTGMIILCRGSDISLWTLNGRCLIEQTITTEGDDLIASCAFYEGNGNEYLARQLIFTGHRYGVVNIWNLAIVDGIYILEHVKRMHHLDQAGFNIPSSMTAILPMAQAVYTGDEDGRIYEWDCIQRQ